MIRRYKPSAWDNASMFFLLACVLAFLIALIAAARSQPMPDDILTPGVARTDLTVEQICSTKWGKDERAVSVKMKRQTFHLYGYAAGNKDPRCPCEVDHRLSRELGGADVQANLWIQPYRGICNARDKDRLENRLHRELCAKPSEELLSSVRSELLSDWQSAYVKRFGPCG